MTFSVQNIFSRLTFVELLKKKKKCEEIYRHKSTHLSRSNKTVDQSFMTNLKIYLQHSKRRFLDVAPYLGSLGALISSTITFVLGTKTILAIYSSVKIVF